MAPLWRFMLCIILLILPDATRSKPQASGITEVPRDATVTESTVYQPSDITTETGLNNKFGPPSPNIPQQTSKKHTQTTHNDPGIPSCASTVPNKPFPPIAPFTFTSEKPTNVIGTNLPKTTLEDPGTLVCPPAETGPTDGQVNSVPSTKQTTIDPENLPLPTSGVTDVEPPDEYIRPACPKKSSLKRWFGVRLDPHDEAITEQDTSAWPWPEKCGVNPVRYCYKDSRSKRNLRDIVHAAIARWAPAMQEHISTLIIELDVDDESVLCSDDRVSDDALVISDATRDGADEYNWNECATETSFTGYNAADWDLRGRHTLDFCHLIPGDEEKRDLGPYVP